MNSFRKVYIRRAHRLVTAFSVIPLLIYSLLGLKISFLAPGFELNPAHSDSCGCFDGLLSQYKWIAVMGTSMTILNILTGIFLFNPKRHLKKFMPS